MQADGDRRRTPGAEELLALIVHDVAAPLATIRRLAEHLADRVDDLSPAAREVATALAASTARTSMVLDELLGYARGAAPVPRRLVDLDELLRDVLSELRPLLEESQVTVVSEALPQVWARPVMIRQVLVNLLSNVARHAGPPARATISARMEDAGCVVSVRDDGPGMPAGVRQVLEAEGPPLGGRLGLFLTQQLVRAEGGRIWVTDVADGGAEVCFALPRRRGDHLGRERARSSTASA